MDIAGLSMAMAQQNIKTDVGVAMLKNTMDMVKQEGAAVAEMVASAPAPADPNLGSNVDIKL